FDPANRWHGRADLLFEDGKVVEVESELAAPRGAQVVDAHGSFVVPGLIDTHTHIAAGRWQGHAMIARVGVTTALNLAGRTRDVIEGIKVSGAGLNIASLDSLEPGEQLSSEAPPVEEIQTAVDRAVQNGAL